jgi:hypothetical protein
MESFLNLARLQRDRVAAVVVAALGAVALLLSWIGVSGQGLPAGQIPYLVSGALFSIFAVGLAATLWLSADLRDEWRKLDDIELALAMFQPSSLRVPDPSVLVPSAPRNGRRRSNTAAVRTDRISTLSDEGFRPWSFESLLKLILSDTVAGGFIAGSWFAASGVGSVRQQLPWVAGSLASLVLAGGANALWLLRGRRFVGLRRVSLLPGANAIARSNGHVPRGDHVAADAAHALALVSAPNMAHYHQTSCALAVGKPCRSATRTEHEANGLIPCGVCEP